MNHILHFSWALTDRNIPSRTRQSQGYFWDQCSFERQLNFLVSFKRIGFTLLKAEGQVSSFGKKNSGFKKKSVFSQRRIQDFQDERKIAQIWKMG